MPKLDEIRAEKLIELARARFDPYLWHAELRVLRDSASSLDPDMPDAAAPRPYVRPEFIRWLVTDSKAVPHIDPEGLRAYGIRIDGNLDLEHCRIPIPLIFRRCTFEGKVNIKYAETRAIFFLDSSFDSQIVADGIDVQGSLLLRESSFSGVIRLRGAIIKGDLDCSGAKLKVEEGNALSADRAEIGGSVFLRTDFESSGTIRLHSAQIGGQVAVFDAKVAKLICRNLRLTGNMYWMGIKNPLEAVLDLSGASVKNLCDDRDSWPAENHLFLDGLVYEDLTLYPKSTFEDFQRDGYLKELPLKCDERIEWLKFQPSARRLEAQPWMQLARLFEAKGDRRRAKHVVYNFRKLRAQQKWSLPRWWAIFFAWLEESPIRILLSIAAFVALGTLIFTGANRSGAMIESVRILPNGTAASVSYRYPPFQPFVYSLENSLPLIKLGMDEHWIPDPTHVPQPWFPDRPCLDWLKFFNAYWFLAITRWLLILSGWVQATILVAAVSDRFKK